MVGRGGGDVDRHLADTASQVFGDENEISAVWPLPLNAVVHAAGPTVLRPLPSFRDARVEPDAGPRAFFRCSTVGVRTPHRQHRRDRPTRLNLTCYNICANVLT